MLRLRQRGRDADSAACERVFFRFKTKLSAAATSVYDGWNPIIEIILHVCGATTANQYLGGLDFGGTFQGAGIGGGLVPAPLNGALYFPLADSNGNITEYVYANGVIVAQCSCDAFDDTLVESCAISGASPFAFSTNYYDSKTWT